jgi:hypothetical protein
MTQQVTGYNGLIEVKDTLPASYYIDPTHYGSMFVELMPWPRLEHFVP